MDEEEDQKHREAIQSFKEFTGNQDDLTARRLLMINDWNVQRAINIFFMRGAPPQLEETRQRNLENDMDEDEIQSIEPTTSDPKRRISHFVKRNKHFGDKAHSTEELKEHKQNKNDDNSEDNIRAPIPSVKGIILAQTFQQTYDIESGGIARKSTSIFDQFRNLPIQNKVKNSDDIEELMEESVNKTSTSSTSTSDSKFNKVEWSPPTSSFHRFQIGPKRKHHQRLNLDDEDDSIDINESNNERQLVNNSEEKTLITTTGGFGQGIKRRRDLRLLFRPPTDLIFYGDWDSALQSARQNNLWLIVNVQHSTEFACAVLNRDIWSVDAVRDIVKTNFLLWQVYHDSSDGIRVKCYYHFETYPALFIVDPRTGEEVLKLQAPDSVTFLENLTTFLSRYPNFEARDQEFKKMALLGDKHPLLCKKFKEEEEGSSPILSKNTASTTSNNNNNTASTSSCGKKRKQI